MSQSPAAILADLPKPQRIRFLRSMPPEAQEALQYYWAFWARPEQLPPTFNPRTADGKWRTWLNRAGRGFGKTRGGAEWVRAEIESGRRRAIGLIGPTKEATRKVMVEGVSGILAICPPSNRPVYEPSNFRLVWPSGAMAHTFTAEEPEKLRGPNLDGAWSDEICAWGGGVDAAGNVTTGNNNQASHAYDMLQLCLRIPGPKGDPPQEVITTTPKPMPLLRQIMANIYTVVTSGAIFDNAANLDAASLKYYVEKYQGSRLARQELYGEMLDAFEGAYWSPEVLDKNRLKATDGWKLAFSSNAGAPFIQGPKDHQHIYFKRIVVAIDPAGTANRKSNETGMIVCALGMDDDGYILADRSGVYSPEGWASVALDLYETFRADRVVAEVNYGGDMVEATIRAANRNIAVRKVVATRGKAVRAQPVSMLDDQGRIHHVGEFPRLEDQMVTWDPLGTGESPDRVDARVWGITDLMLKRHGFEKRGFSPAIMPIFAR